MRRILITLFLVIGILVIGILIIFRKDKLPELVNYYPVRFTYASSKPLFFKRDNDLYYSADGTFDTKNKLISDIDIKYQQSKKYVSPNSKIILVYKENYILIISNSGKIINKLDSVKTSLCFEKHIGKYWNDNIQWTADSKGFIIAKDELYGNSYLYRYSIDSGSTKPFLRRNIKFNYYLSRDEKNVYHKEFNPISNKNELLKTNVKTLASTKIDSNGLIRELDSIFINYPYIGNNSYQAFGLCDKSISILTKRDMNKQKGGVYVFRADHEFYLIKALNGYNAEKSHDFNIMLSGPSYFLPGDKFFLLDCETKQNRGSIIIDLHNYRYMEIDRIEEIYFSYTTDDCRNMVFIKNELK